MKSRKLNKTIAAVLVVSAALGGTAVIAAETQKAPASAAQPATDPLLPLKVSDHAVSALDSIGVARMALMQWSGDQASSVLGEVKRLLTEADGITPATLTKSENTADHTNANLTDSLYFPVAYQSFSTERMVPVATAAPEKTAAAQTTGTSEEALQIQSEQQLAAAETPPPAKDVRETLDMSFIVALLPKDATLHAIDEAIAQIDKGDLAAADLKLASIGDSILYGSMTQESTSS